MKKLNLSIATLIIASILLTGCRKDDKVLKPEDSFDALEAKYISNEQKFFVDAAAGGTITLREGTKIVLGPNFARTAAGAAVSGQVAIIARESRKKSTWLMDGLSTMTATDPLVSGGMLNLRALSVSSGEELVRNPSSSVVVTMPPIGSVDSAMRLFLPAQGATGTPNNTAPVVQWRESAASFNVTLGGYSFNLPQFGWANCDRLYAIPGPKTTVNVAVTGNTGATNEKVVFVYKNINTVINLTTKPAPNTWASYNNSVPVGSVADVLYLAESPSGKAYFKLISNNTFSAGQTINLAAEEVSASVVDTYLKSL